MTGYGHESVVGGSKKNEYMKYPANTTQARRGAIAMSVEFSLRENARHHTSDNIRRKTAAKTLTNVDSATSPNRQAWISELATR